MRGRDIESRLAQGSGDLALDRIGFPKTHTPLPTAHHVIHKPYADRFQCGFHFTSHYPILLRRLRTPTRMIVSQDHRGGPLPQSSASDLSGENSGAVDGASGEDDSLDDTVAGVQQEGGDNFLGFASVSGAAVVGDEAGVGESVGASDVVAERGDGRGAGGEKSICDGGSRSAYSEDLGARGIEEAADAAAEGS